ncbi:MAG: hypothetical protein WKG06_34575 [Segetibacter sp.]
MKIKQLNDINTQFTNAEKMEADIPVENSLEAAEKPLEKSNKENNN